MEGQHLTTTQLRPNPFSHQGVTHVENSNKVAPLWRGSPAKEKWDPEEQVFVGAIETPAPSLSQQSFPVAMR